MKILNNQKISQFPDAILFDIDNTLYPYDPAHEAAHNAIQKKVVEAYSLSSDDFNKAFRQARIDIKSRLEGTAASHSRLLYMQRMLEIIGLGSQALLALDLEQTYWRTFLSNAQTFEGVKDLMEDIRLWGIPTAVVTDLTAQIQFRKIIYLGLDSYFDHIVTSEEAGFDKPHNEPYSLAIEKLQPKGNCVWMVGDNPSKDIQGARESIGAITFQKIHKGVSLGIGSATPDVSFKDFSSLRDLLIRLNEAS